MIPDIPHPSSNFGSFGQHGQAQSTSEINTMSMNAMGARAEFDENSFYRMTSGPVERIPKN